METHTGAVAPAPWTFSSVPSILTGLYPHRHGAAYPDDASRNQDLREPPNKLSDDVYSLPEILGQNGYETGFFTAIGTAAIPVRGRVKTLRQRHDSDAVDLLSEFREWWNKKDNSKFGYVQLGDLHEPLHTPDLEFFEEIPDIDGTSRWRFQSGETDSEQFENYRDARILLYDTLLRYVDQEIENLISDLNDIEDTIVIVTSDHGEEFWEFANFERQHFDDPRNVYGVGHGHALVPPVLEVPIITNLESVRDRAGFDSLTDIVPTIIHELGIDLEIRFDGTRLQDSREDQIVLSEEIAYGPNQISVTTEDNHLIYMTKDNESVLIDFDSGDYINNDELEQELRAHVPKSSVSSEVAEISDEVRRQLFDLGYTE